jgi:hypothetical protein
VGGGAEEGCLAAMVALMMQSDVQREKDAPPGHEVSCWSFLMKDAGAGRGDVGTYCRRRPPARVLKLHGGLGRVAGGRWYVHITQDLVDALGRPFSDSSFSFILSNHRGPGGSGGHWVTCG